MASTSDEMSLPIMWPMSNVPLSMLWSTPSVKTMQRTSVRADSSTSVVRLSLPTLSTLTIGMTTADDVPPQMKPVISPTSTE